MKWVIGIVIALSIMTSPKASADGFEDLDAVLQELDELLDEMEAEMEAATSQEELYELDGIVFKIHRYRLLDSEDGYHFVIDYTLHNLRNDIYTVGNEVSVKNKNEVLDDHSIDIEEYELLPSEEIDLKFVANLSEEPDVFEVVLRSSDSDEEITLDINLEDILGNVYLINEEIDVDGMTLTIQNVSFTDERNEGLPQDRDPDNVLEVVALFENNTGEDLEMYLFELELSLYVDNEEAQPYPLLPPQMEDFKDGDSIEIYHYYEVEDGYNSLELNYRTPLISYKDLGILILLEAVQ